MFDLAAVTLLSLALNGPPADSSYGPQTPPAPASAARDAPADTTTARPGTIRPAQDVTGWQKHDDDHRGFACHDDNCKTKTPVYNTETPLDREQGRLGAG